MGCAPCQNRCIFYIKCQYNPISPCFFWLSSAVSYLPMPVIGGYLAFIGYFCLEAGVGLAISDTIMSVTDWSLLLQPSVFLLAFPALVAGLVLTWLSRSVKNDAALPMAMIIIPGIFYVVIFVSGVGMDGARSAGWMGGNFTFPKLSCHFFAFET
jgi:hypothetical protein